MVRKSIDSLVQSHMLVASVVIAAICAGLIYLATMLFQTREVWSEYAEMRSPKALAVNLLTHHLGYGGLVHNYHNAMLRPGEDYSPAVFADIGAVRAVLSEYEASAELAIEHAAMETIRRELDHIGHDMTRLPEQAARGMTPEEIFAGRTADFGDIAKALGYLATVNGNDIDNPTPRLRLNQLESSLGLAGMIHNLKAALLSKRSDRIEAAQAAGARAGEILLQLSENAHTTAERTAIGIVERTVDEYREKIELAARMITEGASASEIDSVVRVEDRHALVALWTLASFETTRLNDKVENISAYLAPQQPVILALAAVMLLPVAGYLARRGVGMSRQMRDWSLSLSETVRDVTGKQLVPEPANSDADAGLRQPRAAPLDDMLEHIHTAIRDQQARVDGTTAELEKVTADCDSAKAELLRVRRELREALAAQENARANTVRVRRASDLMNGVLSAIPSGVLAVSRDGQFLFWNAQMPKILGLQAEWFTQDRTFWDLLLYGATRGDYGAGDPWELASEVQSRIESELDEGAAHYEVHLPDNRVIEFGAVQEHDGARVFTAMDITERHQFTKAMEERASTDPLTGLANRDAHDTFLASMLQHARRAGDLVALLTIDLDGFKPINDEHGHAAGDKALVEVASRLQEEIRETDLAARMGGDEFSIILTHIDDEAGAERFARRVLRALQEPIEILPCLEVTVTASIGIALYPTHAGAPDVLFRKSDEALYEAKKAGKNQVMVCKVDRHAKPTIVTRDLDASEGA